MFQPLRTQNLGYWLIVVMLVAAGMLDLTTPLLTVLFSYFILRKLRFGRSKWLPTIVFILILLGFLYLFGSFIRQAVVALPRIAEDSIPKIFAFAQQHGVHLPFQDLNDKSADELKAEGIDWLKTQLRYLANFARIASKEFAFLLIGVIVAICIFFNPALDLKKGSYPLRNNLYSFTCDEILKRFRSFYTSFARVMGAQILISMINTSFTAIYVSIVHLPYAALIVALTFICGLLPIIGNLISNSVIVALSIIVSPQLAIASLVFLIVLHKLEYFLNGKIIGERINNPIWLTLLGLLVGERLMGIPGMILAPVVLDFIRNEASTIEIPAYAPKRVETPTQAAQGVEVISED